MDEVLNAYKLGGAPIKLGDTAVIAWLIGVYT